MTNSRNHIALADKALALLRQAELVPRDPGAILPRQVGALSMLAELLSEDAFTPQGIEQAAGHLYHIEAWFEKQLADGYASLDLAAVLESRCQIAHIWGIEDVAEVRPDLTGEQAWEVLRYADRRINSDLGISWDTLSIYADELYPEPDDSTQSNATINQ
jgi:hypothetical protein